MSKRLEKHLLTTSCGIITGDRGTGKSTLFAYIADVFLKEGYPVYCQYPYKGCYQIPLIQYTLGKTVRYDIDKDWLYSTNLSGCCILIDEARTIWPARSYAKWTVADEDFFNLLRKNDMHIFLATQAYDGLDLNVKRATDETFYLTRGFWHFTHIEASHTTLAKVADKTTEVQGRLFKKGMQKVIWDICEVPSGNYLFWRKSWYNKFVSTQTFLDKEVRTVPYWDEVFDFDEVQSEQGYTSRSSLIELWKDYFSRKSKIDEISEEDMTDEEFFNDDYSFNENDYIFDNIPSGIVKFVGHTSKISLKEKLYKLKDKRQNNSGHPLSDSDVEE